MALALDEEHCGVEADLVYPNVQSCIALAVGTTGGTLAGMHLTMMTTPAQIQAAAQALAPSLVGSPDSIVCLGNIPKYATPSGGLIFPGTLRSTLKAAFGYAGNVTYFDTSVLFNATNQNLANGGVVVRAWRDPSSNVVRYALGPHTAATRAGTAAVLGPWFKVSSVRTTNKTGQPGDTYTLGRLSDVPALGLATM